MPETGYVQGSGALGRGGASPEGLALADLKKGYLSYLEVKREEIEEQQDARRYYHGAQLTAEQLKVYRARKQPAVTYNRIGRKINAVVGLLDRQKADPRAFPRTPNHEEGAEIATATLLYCVDRIDWPTLSTECGLDAAVDGFGGLELLLEQGDRGDIDVVAEKVDPSSFFYDPRSMRPDFSDARFMGVGKWVDLETAIELFPNKEDELRASLESGSELTSHPDSDDKWLMGNDGNRKLRIVDHWYLRRGEWRYCVYTGTVKLAEGESFLRDERGKSLCKFLMFSANVDHDGDRYGFVRNMRSAQDEINQRRSKALHILNTRRMTIQSGQKEKAEEWRREAARPDGVIVYDPGTERPEFDDAVKNAELTAQLGFLEEAKNEIENYGFNPALMGQGVQNMSGRAIALQQQAGVAELGPFLLSYRGWKLRTYRALWNAIQQHWTAERWIRVTDDEQVAQFMAINQLGIDPRTGLPTIINALGSLDVDIILDEGPDVINMQADAYETLSLMATRGQNVPPQLLIELSPLHGSVKRKALQILEQANQPGPAQQAAIQLEMQGKEAENAEAAASAQLKQAQAAKAMAEAGGGEQINPGEVAEQQARTLKTMAEARHISMETELLPLERLQPQKTSASVSI